MCQRSARSGAPLRANGIPPAARRLVTAGASREGITVASAVTPWVVGDPATSIDSFTVNGTPWKGLVGAPRAVAASASSAAANASPASVSVTALTVGFTLSMRARCASTTSRLDTTRSRIDVPSSNAPRSQSSLIAAALRQRRRPTACGLPGDGRG